MVRHHLSQHHLIWEIYFFATLLFDIARKDPGLGCKLCVVIEEAHTVIPEWNFIGVEGEKSPICRQQHKPDCTPRAKVRDRFYCCCSENSQRIEDSVDAMQLDNCFSAI